MIELTVGSRFWYKDKLYEVAIINDECMVCQTCPFVNKRCYEVSCTSDIRQDNKDVYFKEVKE